jgi:hypothetical protein
MDLVMAMAMVMVMAMVMGTIQKSMTNRHQQVTAYFWAATLLVCLLSACKTKRTTIPETLDRSESPYFNDFIGIQRGHKLSPGIYRTKPLNKEAVRVGDEHLLIEGSDKEQVVIKRADHSLPQNPKKDFYHGLYFLPDPPSADEIKKATWTKHSYPERSESFYYTIISRGSIEIKNLTVDCNMNNQLILDGDKFEHSSMFRFQGLRHIIPDGRYKDRVVFIAFEEIKMQNVHFINGGYVDNIWISRPYFQPNIQSCVFEDITEDSRLNGKRASIGFSSPVAKVQIRNSDVYKLELESTDLMIWDKVPGNRPNEWTSIWKIEDSRFELLDLAHKGNTVYIDANELDVSKATMLYQLGGNFKNSRFRVQNSERRLNRLRSAIFDQVVWTIEPDANGVLGGLRLCGQYGQAFSATFINNTFNAIGEINKGQLIDSEYSPSITQSIQVRFIDCIFDDRMGKLPNTSIAVVNEKGSWTFDGLDQRRSSTIVKGESELINLRIVE